MKLRFFFLIFLSTFYKVWGQPGLIDYSFRTDFDFATPASSIYHAAAQSDGKIVIGGSFKINFLTKEWVSNLARLLPDGSLDLSFNIGFGLDEQVNHMAVLPDDKILISGYFKKLNGIKTNCFIRLNANGTIDSSFNTNYFENAAFDFAIQPDGKIVVSGVHGINKEYALIRLNKNGSLDSTFNVITYEKTWMPRLAVLPNGNILFSGSNTLSNLSMGMLDSKGNLDKSFRPNEEIRVSDTKKIEIQQGRKIIMSGTFYINHDSQKVYILRINMDGSLDKSFAIRNRLEDSLLLIQSSVVQSDGKIIVSGFFQTFNVNKTTKLIRLNIDGNIDKTFNDNDGFDAGISNLSKYYEDKVIAVGTFSSFGSFLTSRIARVNIVNSLDRFNFTTSSNPNNGTFWVDANSNMKLVVVYDLTGHEILRIETNVHNLEIDLKGKANGLYYIRVFSEDGNQTQRILKL